MLLWTHRTGHSPRSKPWQVRAKSDQWWNLHLLGMFWGFSQMFDWMKMWGIWNSGWLLELCILFFWFLSSFYDVTGCVVLLGSHCHHGVQLPWGEVLSLQDPRFLIRTCIYTDIKRTYTTCAMPWIVLLNCLRLKCHQLRAERRAPARPLSELNNVTPSGSKQHNR